MTDEQQSTRLKAAQPSGLGRRRRLAALLALMLTVLQENIANGAVVIVPVDWQEVHSG
ncbi:MAG: hypothetical protein JO151_17830 [Verrucomicrobia bacterium]|nr:hypothetical protein [Verrucomicrobiota bacterium]